MFTSYAKKKNENVYSWLIVTNSPHANMQGTATLEGRQYGALRKFTRHLSAVGHNRRIIN